MMRFHEQHLVAEEGTPKAVVVPISTWKQMFEAFGEFDDIRAYDEAKRKPSELTLLSKPFPRSPRGFRIEI
jgi:hypothetical protein